MQLAVHAALVQTVAGGAGAARGLAEAAVAEEVRPQLGRSQRVRQLRRQGNERLPPVRIDAEPREERLACGNGPLDLPLRR